MNQTLTIAKREVTALFYSPIAYLVLAVFALVASLLFIGGFFPGSPATMRDPFGGFVFLMVFLVPAISMRGLSEEFNSGSVEMLMTAPVSDTQVILGKWLGAFCFFCTLLVPMLAHVIVLEIYAQPEYGPIFTGLVGLLFVGGLYLAIGIFISTLTDSQLIAFLVTVLITGFLTIGMTLLGRVEALPTFVRDAMFYINVNQQFGGFAKGLIDVRNLVFFISGTALFLFFGVVALQSRRWR